MLNEWHRRRITRFADLSYYWLVLRAVSVIDRKGVVVSFCSCDGKLQAWGQKAHLLSVESRVGRDLLKYLHLYMLVCQKYVKTAMYQLHHLRVPSGSNWIYQTPVCDCSNNPCCYWGHRHPVPQQRVWVSRRSRLKGVTDNLHTIPWDTHLVTNSLH